MYLVWRRWAASGTALWCCNTQKLPNIGFVCISKTLLMEIIVAVEITKFSSHSGSKWKIAKFLRFSCIIWAFNRITSFKKVNYFERFHRCCSTLHLSVKRTRDKLNEIANLSCTDKNNESEWGRAKYTESSTEIDITKNWREKLLKKWVYSMGKLVQSKQMSKCLEVWLQKAAVRHGLAHIFLP